MLSAYHCLSTVFQMYSTNAGTSKEDEEEDVMDEPPKKVLKTMTGVSAMLDLKNEVFKRKGEAGKRQEKVPNHSKKNVIFVKNDEKTRLREEKAARKARINAHEEALRREEAEQVEFASRRLREKAELYEKLAESGVRLDEDIGEPLIDFNAKRRERELEKIQRREEEEAETSVDDPLHFVAGEEPRMYGASHVIFSRNEEKRQKEMSDLIKMSSQTEKAREKTKTLAEKRAEAKKEKDRLLRERLGLQPVVDEPEEEPEPLDIPLPPEEKKEEKREERPLPKEREWDRGKGSVTNWGMAPRDPSFPELLSLLKGLRSDSRASSGVPFSRLSLRKNEDKVELLALGTGGGSQQTLLAATINDAKCCLERVVEPTMTTSSPSQSLQAERQRMSSIGGVTHMSLTSTSRIMLGMGDEILTMDRVDGRFSIENTRLNKTILDVQACPCNERLCAVAVEQSVIILKDGRVIYESEDEGPDISCGMPSFITQEEMERFHGMWWSDSEPLLLYERVDESDVERVLVSTKQPPMKYPLAGTPNAKSSLRLLYVNGDNVTDYPLKKQLSKHAEWMEYIARAGFMQDGKTVWVLCMDREQCRSAIFVIPLSEFMPTEDYNSIVRQTTTVYEETSQSWINVTHNLTQSLSLPQSPWCIIHGIELDTYLSLILLCPSSPPRQITETTFNVHKGGGVFVDESRELVYYFAHVESPVNVHFCVSSVSSFHQESRALTDSVESCRVERAIPSASVLFGSSFVVWQSSLSTPPSCVVYSLIHIPLKALPTSQRLCTVDQSCSPLSPWPRLCTPRILEFVSSSSQCTHYALLHTPPGEGPFPIIHFVYGGPGVQLVRNEWSAWVHLQKFVALGYAAVMIDGRGSDNRGKHWESAIKRRLGEVELVDQVEGLKKVVAMSGGILDLNRVAIHGWSYGGYMAVLALALHPNVYRCAVAGGTVVDWSFYDTAYTERYLGLSLSSYCLSNIERVVKCLPDVPGRLMLAHGLQDENVHFRHVELLIDMLIKAGKPYSLQLFPSERHGLRSIDSSTHFDASMFLFISQALRD